MSSKAGTSKMEPEVKQVFEHYPPRVNGKMRVLRSWIFSLRDEFPEIEEINETLKWGEPSYLTKQGSTLRIDWKEKQPDSIGIYFNCQTTLIENIKQIYGDKFHYEGKRAIHWPLSKELDEDALKHCFSLALRYHSLKDKPLLGG